MKFTSFRGQVWGSDYWAGVPNGGIPMGSVVPNIIYRPGTVPVFGLGQVSEMSVPVRFGYKGALSYENAWIELMKKLDPLNPAPGLLAGQLNDGTAVQTTAVITVPAQAEEEVNGLTVVFVCVNSFFSGIARSLATGTFA
jgi:hypothetical protein